MATASTGLAGITAGETAICTVGAEGSELRYRGYSILELIENASFEETAYLLIHGELPNLATLTKYREQLRGNRELPADMKATLQQIPATAHPMDVLRTGASFLGTVKPETEQFHGAEIADLLLAIFPGMLLYWYHYHHSGLQIETQTDALTTAEHFFTLFKQDTPDVDMVSMLDDSLVLYAEHEFNASTFAARVTAATLSDFYSAACSAIGTLRGPLHGGANEQAFKLISSFETPDDAEKGILERLSNSDKIMGFGHRVYTKCDPRSDVIKHWADKLSDDRHSHQLFKISERIDTVMHREKNLFPNVDFYSAAAYALCDIPTPLFTPIFVLARITGWSAHILEQRENNRLIRPAADYVGPKARPVPPIDQR